MWIGGGFLEFYADVVEVDGAIIAADDLNVADLESAIFEVVDRAAEDVVSLLFKFGRGFAGALGGGKHIGADAIGASFGGIIVSDQANGSGGLRARRIGVRLIVEPVPRGE